MEKIWLKSYPPGMQTEIDTSQYRSLVQLLEESFHKYADRNAYVCMDKYLTYAEVDLYSKRLGAWLQSRGLKPGARVAIMMPNVLQYPIAIAAILRAGYTVVNVNPLYTPRELEHQLNDSGSEAIIMLENFATTLEQVLGRPGQAHRRGQHGRDAGRPQRHAGQFRRAQRQEDGAAVLAAECRALQGCAVAGRRHEADAGSASTTIPPSCSTRAAPRACPRAPR
jgi:acyl-CoA synthetase (AMP-forming)/AMP-acid ligase II